MDFGVQKARFQGALETKLFPLQIGAVMAGLKGVRPRRVIGIGRRSVIFDIEHVFLVFSVQFQVFSN